MALHQHTPLPRNDRSAGAGPPAWADRLLRVVCPPELHEELLGDLHEQFQEQVAQVGESTARRLYVWEVIRFCRPYLIGRQLRAQLAEVNMVPSLLNPNMLQNYLKIAFRNLVRNKGYSAINIGGLAVGMAVAILNGLWLWDELTFNTYHQTYNRVAKVTERGITSEKKPYLGTYLPYPVAGELKTNYGDYFKHILLALKPDDYILATNETNLTQKGQFIESGAPDMLALKMLEGTRNSLSDPHSILLSTSAAQALFGHTNPLNKLVRINANMDARVTGVYEDLPHNTEFRDVKFFAPFSLWVSVNPWVKDQGWNNWFVFTYAQLQPQANFDQVSNLIKDIELDNLKKLEGKQDAIAHHPQIHLLPMSQWHLHGGRDMTDNSPVQMVWLIGCIGVFVLLLACINFMNLSTARSEKRAREVGIRKAVGSLRGQLISQFFSESFLVVMLAFGLSLMLVMIALPLFNDIAAKQMAIPWNVPYFWLISLGFILLTGFVAGSYPALYLSSFQPIKVLKGASSLSAFSLGRLAITPRKVLVVIQFTVSVTLIIGTTIVYRQLQYTKNRPIGYSRDGLLLIEKKTKEFNGKHELLRKELHDTGVVDEVAESRSSVTNITMWNAGFSRKGTEIGCPNGCGTLSVTPEYGKTVGWQFMAGRDFQRGLTSDSTGLVINESFARLMGITGSPVGEVLTWSPGWRPAKTFTILGVVKDMVAMSPYEPTIPSVFLIENDNNWINIRIKPTVSTSEALPKIEAVFKRLIPTAPFDYKFADQEYALKFSDEERIGKLAAFFASLAIFISCLGLFGLASFTAEQRTKELGVRKVLGASVTNLWVLLSKDFVVLVLIAFGIATPIAFYLLNNWLQKYSYRTELSWWIFAASGAGALVVTLLTVSFQSIKAASINPVKSLRSE
ncbi:FtsX-like permease family protein [Spirosoma litoris]